LFEALDTKARASGTLAAVPHFSEKCHFTGRARGVYDCGAKAMTDSCYRFITSHNYRGADKSSARPGRKQATATEDFDVHIPHL
jgi:hypothetical protein